MTSLQELIADSKAEELVKIQAFFATRTSPDQTTDFAEASCTDGYFFHKGEVAEWDDDHRFTWYVKNDIVKAKYQHLVDNATLEPFDREEFLEDREEMGYDDPEEGIEWYEQRHAFHFTWAWFTDPKTGKPCGGLNSDEVTEWAGLDPADCDQGCP